MLFYIPMLIWKQICNALMKISYEKNIDNILLAGGF
jgi:hypothetical protein